MDAGLTWLKYQDKHGIMVGCEPSEAQFVQSYDGSTIYRVGWLNPAPTAAGTYETIEAEIINRQEFLDLRAVLDEGETPVQPEPEEPEQPPEEEPTEEPETDPQTDQPMTVAQMREKITELEEMLNIIMGVVE